LANLKRRVAQEAATLLYTSQEKEYKQAKMRAAKTLGARVLPSNQEVAREFDRIAEETEGPARRELLLQMRREALQIMRNLEAFHPRLVGSVWRGTAHRSSDIDVLSFSAEPDAVLARLKEGDSKVAGREWLSVTKEGRRESSFHIYLTLPSGSKAEVVVRDPERRGVADRCEIYGDSVTGLTRLQLEKVLEEDPYRRFVPA
jgi:predicted nucleotidyltransferase